MANRLTFNLQATLKVGDESVPVSKKISFETSCSNPLDVQRNFSAFLEQNYGSEIRSQKAADKKRTEEANASKTSK